jgi:hypothetical protein
LCRSGGRERSGVVACRHPRGPQSGISLSTLKSARDDTDERPWLSLALVVLTIAGMILVALAD